MQRINNAKSSALVLTNYKLLATAISGKNTRVYFHKTQTPYSDGSDIYLPQRQDQFTLCRLIAQALLLKGNSLKTQYIIKCIGKPKMARRYLSLELARTIRQFTYLIPQSLNHFYEQCIHDIPNSTSSSESLTVASSKVFIPSPHNSFGAIFPKHILKKLGWPKRGAKVKNKKDTVSSIEIEETDEDVEESIILKLLSSPIPLDNFIMKVFRDQILNLKRSAESSSSSTQGEELASNNLSTVTESTSTLKAKAAVMQQSLAKITTQENSKTYPEWDYKKQNYRDDWCTVQMMVPAMNDNNPSKHPVDYVLKQNLLKFSTGYENHTHCADGELLDLRGLIDYTLSRLTGNDEDPRIFTSRLRSAHNLGVLVLLDASGSLSEKKPDDSLVWDHQTQLLANIVNGLEESGDRVSAYAFKSYGRHDVRFLNIKNFDEPFNHGSQQRLINTQPKGFTRIGAALRHATHLLKKNAGTPRQLVVFISDGFPYEHDYEGLYAKKDTLKSIEEMKQQGIGCVFLNLAAQVQKTEFAEVWQAASCFQLNTPFDLGNNVHDIFNAALQSATESSYGQAI